MKLGLEAEILCLLVILIDIALATRGHFIKKRLFHTAYKRHTMLDHSQLCKSFGCINGNCVASELRRFRIVCTCFPGYEGKLCHRLACPYQCGPYGTCAKEGDMLYCRCKSGWYGPRCDSMQPTIEIIDNIHGHKDRKRKTDKAITFSNLPGLVTKHKTAFDKSKKSNWFAHHVTPHVTSHFHAHAVVDKSIQPDVCAPGFQCFHGRCDRKSMMYGIFRCICEKGYMGLFCSKRCTLRCRNEGQCTVFGDGHQYCICPFDFTGHYCEHRRRN